MASFYSRCTVHEFVMGKSFTYMAFRIKGAESWSCNPISLKAFVKLFIFLTWTFSLMFIPLLILTVVLILDFVFSNRSKLFAAMFLEKKKSLNCHLNELTDYRKINALVFRCFMIS